MGSFGDESTGKIVGQNLINAGCDILFVAAGGSGNGVFTAAKESGKALVIGCDVDQWNDGINGDKNIILTSVLKVMGPNDKKILESISAGTFKGGNYLLKADTNSTGYVKAKAHNQLSASSITAIDAAYEKVKSGEIVPASNFGGFAPKDFKVK